jgi:hypothetical protein
VENDRKHTLQQAQKTLKDISKWDLLPLLGALSEGFEFSAAVTAACSTSKACSDLKSTKPANE